VHITDATVFLNSNNHDAHSKNMPDNWIDYTTKLVITLCCVKEFVESDFHVQRSGHTLGYRFVVGFGANWGSPVFVAT
jgi:hypothetical protein